MNVTCLSYGQAMRINKTMKAPYSIYKFKISVDTLRHYTAMVWKNTSEVGCGFVAGAVPDELGRGGGTDFLVCRYSPSGNIGSEAHF